MLLQVVPIRTFYADIDLGIISLTEENSETKNNLPTLQETEEKIIHYDYSFTFLALACNLEKDLRSSIQDEQLLSPPYYEGLIKPPLYS